LFIFFCFLSKLLFFRFSILFPWLFFIFYLFCLFFSSLLTLDTNTPHDWWLTRSSLIKSKWPTIGNSPSEELSTMTW
jgi:hypothetical protein